MLTTTPRYQKELKSKCKRWMNMNVYDFRNSKVLAEEAASEFNVEPMSDAPDWILKLAEEVFHEKRG